MRSERMSCLLELPYTNAIECSVPPTVTAVASKAACKENVGQKPRHLGGDVSARFGFRWRVLDPDRASSVFSPQRNMVDLMNRDSARQKVLRSDTSNTGEAYMSRRAKLFTPDLSQYERDFLRRRRHFP